MKTLSSTVIAMVAFALFQSGGRVTEAGASLGSDKVTAGAGLFSAAADDINHWPEANEALATFTVTNTNDSGAGSFRQAILNANASAGLDTISFAIPGGGVKTISPTSGGLPGITSPVIIDGYTQPGASTNTLANGNNAVLLIELSGNLLPPQNQGLLITAGGSRVRGLVINRFDNAGQNGGFGIWLDTNGGNIIDGNFIGTDTTGTLDRGNGNDGIFIFNNSQSNTIGGTTPAARNLISGNDRLGILIFGSSVGNNVVQGNFIGTNAAGTGPLGNSHQGIEIGNSPNNTIGGTVPGARNVVSSNGNVSFDSDGINIYGSGATGNVVQGNFVGTNVTGTAALANATEGVSVGEGASNNTIGGTVAGARNLISGNSGGDGVAIYEGATLNTVAGNFIGTDINGTTALGNGDGGVTVGGGSTNNTIGGTATGAGNVISGNGEDGISIYEGGSSNKVEGNFIGTNASGTGGLGNGSQGVTVGENCTGNTIGGITAGARNIISANGEDGIEFYDGASLNRVEGNFIGTNAAGTGPLGNSHQGIEIGNSPNNTIGGTVPGARNVVSSNGNVSFDSDGINIYGSGATGNVVQGNFVGTNVTGTAALANATEGVSIGDGASNNTIGGTSAGARNLISGNSGGDGVAIYNGGTLNKVEGNFIGTDINGTTALGNGDAGVTVGGGSANNTIGGTATGAGNVIAFNGDQGIFASSGAGNRILSNSIFANGALGIDLGFAGVTPNDAGDGDTGPNNLQNFPVLTSVVSGGGSTTIAGALNSTASTAFRVEFFSNVACDPSGNGEGQTFIGSTSVTTTGNTAGINIALPLAVPVGQFVTSTATDAGNNTSEFSPCVIVPVPATVQISGKVTTSGGLGLRNAIVTLTDSQGARRTATTSSFGFYSFTNVAPGQNYTIGVSSKRYRFAARILNVSGELTDVDFVGLE